MDWAFIFPLLSYYLEVEKHQISLRVTNSKNEKKKFWFQNFSHARILYWNETYNSELFEKNTGILFFRFVEKTFVISWFCCK